MQPYLHWRTAEPEINLEMELSVLQGTKDSLEGDYAVLAKSIGTVLTAEAIRSRIIKPRWMLLCGIPLVYVKPNYPQFAEVLANADLPTTVVQNKSDPVGSAIEVQQYVSSEFEDHSIFRFIETPGKSHDYAEFELLREQLTFLRDHNGSWS